jgi:hypothetical protein
LGGNGNSVKKEKGKANRTGRREANARKIKKAKGKTFTTEGNNKGKKCTWGGIPADVGSEM